MKLKYYLRGLGIGIVVTVVVMMAALGNKPSMTDEEVIARAKELGMIENSVLTDIAGKEDVQNDEQNDEQSEVVDNPEPEKVEPENTEPEKVESENTEPEKDEPENIDKGMITITVIGGDSSWSVSKRMEEAGVIESAKDFDTYLCSNGYDKRISVGTYEIPTTATHEEMAKILTKTD